MSTDKEKLAIAQQQASDATLDYLQLQFLYVANSRKLNVAVKGIHDFIDGDYKDPSDYKPDDCPHGTPYYKTCVRCDVVHFENVLESMS